MLAFYTVHKNSPKNRPKYILQSKTISGPLKIATKQHYYLATEKNIPSIKSHFVSMFLSLICIENKITFCK